MAFSTNQQQLFNWGPLYGVEIPELQSELPVASFQYWLRTNRQVLQIGKEFGNERFLLVNFDELYKFPKREIRRIISFLNISPGREVCQRASEILKKPESMGRYRQNDLSRFDSRDLSTLQEFGFKLQ